MTSEISCLWLTSNADHRRAFEFVTCIISTTNAQMLPPPENVDELPLANARHDWQKDTRLMNKLLWIGLACLGWNQSAPAQDKAAAPAATVFQIGVADGDYHEFALAGNYPAYPQTFPHDVDFTVGQSDPKKDWPWIQPGKKETSSQTLRLNP